MKKIFILFVLFFTFNMPIGFGAYYTIEMTSPLKNESLRYSDDKIHVLFSMPKKNPDRFVICLYNKNNAESIVVDWNNLSLVFGGRAFSVVPGSQLKSGFGAYSAINSTNIPPKTVLVETLFVESGVEYIESSIPVYIHGGFGRYRGGWGAWGGFYDDVIYAPSKRSGFRTKAFFPTDRETLEENNFLGYKFSLYMPLEFGDDEQIYNFDFAILDLSIDKSPGWLGAVLIDKSDMALLDDDIKSMQIDKGVLVYDFAKKSAGKKAGLLKNDNIIMFDDTPINSLEDAIKYLNKKNEKDKMKIVFLRSGKRQVIEVKLDKYK